MRTVADDEPGFLEGLLEDGRPAIQLTAVTLLLAAGASILFLGTTDVFVAEDLAYMGVTRGELDRVNPRLVPLIAHDRAGFGGGLSTAGVLVSLCAWYAPPSRSFYQAVVLAGVAGFGCAIVVHYVEGYTNVIHLAPAFAGATLFTASIALELVGMRTVRPLP